MRALWLGSVWLTLRVGFLCACAQTQFEAWLSMQKPTAEGLRGAAEGGKHRWTIVPIYGADSAFAAALEGMWAARSPVQAHAVLSQPDVIVTNASDKVTQLSKLAQLDQRVRAACGGGK